MAELIPTFDELRLLAALRRNKNGGIVKIIINVWTFDIEPIGNVERIGKGMLTDTQLDKKVVTA